MPENPLRQIATAFRDLFTPCPRDGLNVSPEVAAVVKGLGMTRAQIDKRMMQGTRLEAAQVSDELVDVICKISSATTITSEDITRLQFHAAGGYRP